MIDWRQKAIGAFLRNDIQSGCSRAKFTQKGGRLVGLEEEEEEEDWRCLASGVEMRSLGLGR